MTEPSPSGVSLPELEQQRAQLYARLAATGDFRPGSLNATWRKCGKPNCACAQEGHRGHGPRWLWTRSSGGRTRTRQLAAGEVDKVRAELASYKEFTALAEELVQVSEAICEARPAGSAPGGSPAGPVGEKGGSARSSRRRSPRR
ncbi:MAG TPA: DUF6788 family protein [Streptosporangiaceae bacterium]|jgi:hypothetical protein|nr:DUF6788 family protein [Streptosporangiaceae bacterium]